MTLAVSGQRDQQELARFYLDRGRRLFEQENDREAMAELNRALYLSPYLAEAHLLLGRSHLRSGRAREAIDALKISLWSAETAEAHVALGPGVSAAERSDVGARRSRARARARPHLDGSQALLEPRGKRSAWRAYEAAHLYQRA